MPTSDSPQQPEIRPLSRGATKAFVLLCLAIIIGSAVGGAWFLTRTAMDNRTRVETNTGGADSTTVRGFGVTEY